MADSAEEKRRRQREEEAQRRLEEIEARRRGDNQRGNREPPPDLLDNNNNNQEDDSPVLERDDERRERKDREQRLRQDRKKLVNGLEVIDQNEQSTTILKASPLLKLIRFDNINLDYDINENLIQNINMQFNFWYQKRLEILTDDLYNTFFDFESERLSVNRLNKLAFVYSNTSINNHILTKQEFSYRQIKQQYEIGLDFSVSVNPSNNFQKVIYVYETDNFNRIIGKAKLFFGKRKISFESFSLI